MLEGARCWIEFMIVAKVARVRKLVCNFVNFVTGCELSAIDKYLFLYSGLAVMPIVT